MLKKFGWLEDNIVLKTNGYFSMVESVAFIIPECAEFVKTV